MLHIMNREKMPNFDKIFDQICIFAKRKITFLAAKSIGD